MDEMQSIPSIWRLLRPQSGHTESLETSIAPPQGFLEERKIMEKCTAFRLFGRLLRPPEVVTLSAGP